MTDAPNDAVRAAIEGAIKRIDERFDAFLDRYASYEGNVSTDDVADYLCDVRDEIRALSAVIPVVPDHLREAVEAKKVIANALIQARGALRIDTMVDERGNPYGTTVVALEAIGQAEDVLAALSTPVPEE